MLLEQCPIYPTFLKIRYIKQMNILDNGTIPFEYKTCIKGRYLHMDQFWISISELSFFYCVIMAWRQGGNLFLPVRDAYELFTSEKNNAGLVKGDRQNVSIYEAG